MNEMKRDFAKELRDRIRRINAAEHDILIPDMLTPSTMPEKRSILPLFNVIATLNGVSRVVALNVPRNEAEIIQRAVRRKITRSYSLVELDKIDFSITIVDIKRV